MQTSYVQGSTNRRAPGLVNFDPALAYHFCLNLPAAFTQPGAHLLVEHCITFIATWHRWWWSPSLIGPNYKSPSSISTIAIIIFGFLLSVRPLSSLFGGYHAILLLLDDVCRTKMIGGQGREEMEVTQECKDGFNEAKSCSYVLLGCKIFFLS